ncbi:Fe3+-siderophore ABC transporter permease [Virgibacillus sp. SK37]|nr:Fe3+-siderophore ABC transporter permease [Virgibacillus sp. SK37]
MQILFLIVIWVLPAILFNCKMDKKEQQELKNEFKNPFALFGVGFVVIGLLLFSSGYISSLKLPQHIGAIMVVTSWFTTSIVGRKRKKVSFVTSIALMLLGVIGIAVYSCLI